MSVDFNSNMLQKLWYLGATSSALELGTILRASSICTQFEERNWMATHSLPELGNSVLLSFSEEISRRPIKDNVERSINTSNLTTAILSDWAFDAACAYPKWLAQPGFLLQWRPKDIATSTKIYSFDTAGASKLQQNFDSCGELRVAGVFSVLEFGPTMFDSTDATGGGVTTIHITGGLLTSATRQPARASKRFSGTISFECRHTKNGEIELRTALSR